MDHPRRRLFLTLAGVALFVVGAAVVYMVGMARLEGRPRGFWDSLEWAAETLTTTGYGADAHWRHPAMVLFVVGVQFAGVFLVFLIVPLFLIPFLESRFEVRLPQEIQDELAGHVVIYRYGAAVETLLSELSIAGVPTLVLEEEGGVARRLFEAGQRVLHRPLDDAALRAARLGSARAVIANGSDDANAALILAARQTGFAGPVLALVEEPFHRRPMMLAGASAVFTPRHILGAALAARASARINPRVAGVQQLGRKLEVAEVRIEPQSPLVGKTLAEAVVGARSGARVIGQWLGGALRTLPDPAARLQAESVLVVAGSPESVERVAELARGGPPRQGPFLVAGYGEVGRKVVELLLAVGEEVRVIDKRPAPGVDLVGNVIDPGILEAAGAAEAQAVILALDTDSATLFATVILKDAVPAVPVVARVNQAENVERIHRAGAYFALSISQVSGQMLARKLLGEEAVALDPHLKVLQVPAAEVRPSGRRPLSDAEIRRRTGCSVVAVERGDEILVDLPPGFRFDPGDLLYVCGPPESVRRFAAAFV
ncbi:MAG TPA: NAD-binding protein [Solirubrobacterales bacterium]|nr:NAD-binding protein [Solirubrobacterales bacterium]